MAIYTEEANLLKDLEDAKRNLDTALQQNSSLREQLDMANRAIGTLQDAVRGAEMREAVAKAGQAVAEKWLGILERVINRFTE